jgi:uncharacterized protein
MALSDALVDIDRYTGEYIQGWPRARQSIITILTTRLRTRIMRRWWGSDFIDMMDKPSITEVFTKSIVAAIEAINKYEPEFKVSRVTITDLGPEGIATITIDGKYLPEEIERRVQVTL